jgi:putative FmdB family regulatory protein
MPMYEYVCQECQHPFEALVFGDEQAECPECKGRKLERQLSVPGRPKVAASLPTACRSEGPPCGPVCGRWKQ